MNIHQAQLPPLLTVADFVDWPGDGTDTRYELIDGVLRPMAPGSDTHNTIVLNISGLLWSHLRQNKPGYRAVAGPGVQPRLRADWNYRIPDIGVTTAPSRQGEIMTPDPILLIEVLSPGNTQDTWENVRAYATLSSVREIVVVHSTKICADLMQRSASGEWTDNPQSVLSGRLELASIDASLPLTDIYAGTHLA